MELSVTFHGLTIYDGEKAGWGRASLSLVAGEPESDDAEYSSWTTAFEISVPMQFGEHTSLDEIKKMAFRRVAEVLDEAQASQLFSTTYNGILTPPTNRIRADMAGQRWKLLPR